MGDQADRDFRRGAGDRAVLGEGQGMTEMLDKIGEKV
jgi:hypothetical protein